MTRKILSTALATLASLTATLAFTSDSSAQGEAAVTPSSAPATPPKLIVAISVDQLSADLFAEYRGNFTGGLARLASGVVFASGYQAHAATETCPGHSTILTGSHPGRAGIVANNYFDLSVGRADKRIYCAEDESVADSASGSGKYAPSVVHLLVPTLGDRMKDRDPATQVVAVSGKDRASIMMGGRKADELLWLAPTGLTSYRGTALSSVAAQASQAIAAAMAETRPGLTLPADCRSRDVAVSLQGGGTIGNGRLGRVGGNFRGFMASPEADGAVLATGAALRTVRKMGEGSGTDLLILGLSATDYVGHTYGTEGAEMCLQMTALDRELGDFFTRLDATGIDYAVVLTADHGGHDAPERNRQNGINDAQRVDPALMPEALGKAVAEKLGLTTTPLLYADGPFGDYYLSKALSAAQRKAVLAEVTTRLRAHPQVEMVVTGEELAARSVSKKSPELWDVKDRLRASWHPQRSGDFLVVLKPRVTPIPDSSAGYVATHGSVWDYDRRVPILFWRKGMAGFEQPNAVMTVDILPTLAGLIKLPVDPAGIDGQCRDLIAGATSSCP